METVNENSLLGGLDKFLCLIRISESEQCNECICKIAVFTRSLFFPPQDLTLHEAETIALSILKQVMEEKVILFSSFLLQL